MAVRRESVVLDLDVHGTGDVLGAAAAVKTLEGSLRDVDGTSASAGRSLSRTSRDVDGLSNSAVKGTGAIDRYSGRMGILLKLGASLGPALIPISAVAIPAVTGLANQLGFAAIAGGTAVIAFQGVGTALTALNKASLDPTVKNLEAAHEALKSLTPAGRSLVAQFDAMRPILDGLRDTAQSGMFPGLIEGFRDLERLAPSVDAILSAVSSTLGDLFAAGAESLTSSRWSDFFAMLALDARPVLTDMAHALGSVVHGLSEMWEAFQPLNRDFGSWLAGTAKDFDRWATGLSQTQGFQEFISYIRENGPVVAEAMSSLGNAVVQIVQAAAPLGGPVLSALTAFADVVATIADSPLGTPIMTAVTAMSALSLATNAATAATLRLKAAQATLVAGGGKAAAGGAAGGALLGGAKGNLVTLAAIEGTIMGVNLVDNFVQVLQGDRGLREAGDAVATWSNPFTAALKTIGIDVYGAGDAMGATTVASKLMKEAIAEQGNSVNYTTREWRHLGRTLFSGSAALLRNARESERVDAALKEQRQVVRAAGDEWGDYSAKVQTAAGPSMDDLLRRWDRIAEASQDFGTNLRDALERGINPRVLQDVIRQLGPRGAAGALEDFANASGDKAKQIEGSFRRMSRGVRNTESAIDAVDALLSGNGLSLDPSGIVSGAKKGRQSIADLADGVSGAILGLKSLDKQKPKPDADLNIDPLRSGVASAEQLLAGLDGDVARASIIVTTYHNSVHNPSASTSDGFGPQSGAADGGTVPKTGRHYADRHRYLLADGEEIISNRFGQADRHRSLLKAINAGRPINRASERPMSSGRGGGTVRHVVEVQVVGGEMDLTKAKAQIDALVTHRTRDELDQDRSFAGSRR